MELMREINSDTYKVHKQMMIGKYAPPFNHVIWEKLSKQLRMKHKRVLPKYKKLIALNKRYMKNKSWKLK